jgi:aryl-alcohol dehydrogenase-like predicted oxidoreductase
MGVCREFRHLGRSGLEVSGIGYGNWFTHGSRVEEDAAKACVSAALDEGITTFDTADVYAGTKAEEVLGRALQGVRRESLEIFTKVYWPTGPGVNDRGLSRKHITESIHGSLRRLRTDYVDLYQAHRFDYETPLEETLKTFDDLVRQGKVLYVGVSEWKASQIAEALRIADQMGFDSQPLSGCLESAGAVSQSFPSVHRRFENPAYPAQGYPMQHKYVKNPETVWKDRSNRNVRF